jgi:ankyrin repeat protein
MEAVIGTESQEDIDNFFQAIKNEDYELMEKLISEKKINLNKLYEDPQPSNGTMCMACHAITFQKEEVFKFLMRKGTDFNLYATQTILNYSIANIMDPMRSNVIKFLLENKTDPNFIPPLGEEVHPLFSAIRKCKMEIVELLLRYGADPNVINKEGKTTLWEASKIILLPFRFLMVKLLLEYNANSEDKSFLENISDPEKRKELEGLCYSKRKGLRPS